jgi:adenine-specific DNA methylase
LARDLAHSRPHRFYTEAPLKPFEKFLASVERVLANTINAKSADRGPAPTIHLGDARRLPVEFGSIDLVLTSPPYLNAIDYLRCRKFSLVWMGESVSGLRQIRSNSVCAETAKKSTADDPEFACYAGDELKTLMSQQRGGREAYPLSSRRTSERGKYK